MTEFILGTALWSKKFRSTQMLFSQSGLKLGAIAAKVRGRDISAT
jgi:hypothetical protein